MNITNNYIHKNLHFKPKISKPFIHNNHAYSYRSISSNISTLKTKPIETINLKNIKNSKNIIPLKIFQTWYTKDLPIHMKNTVDKLKRENPEFQHYLFDDNDCREFIRTNFDKNVLNAYDTLIPGAFKADLWRLCVLYINGGIYMDIKLSCINGFKLIELTNQEHLVRDRIQPLSILNAFMISKPRNPYLWKCIYRIVFNTKLRYYGNSALEPTGPVLLGNVILYNNFPVNIDIIHAQEGGYLIYKGRPIISTMYKEYRLEQNRTYAKINKQRYNIMWNNRNIYK
jgi:mannosyltransferase OCH1-like enzyme